MTSRLLAVSIVVLVATLGSVSCSRPPIHFSDGPLSVDDFPAWSPDGSTIAFQRRTPSSYGSAGLYLIPANGGVPSSVTPQAYNFLTWDHSGTTIVAVGSRGLVEISTTNGSERLLTFTDNGIVDPHVSADGSMIVYARVGHAYDEPRDSAGLHLFDRVTGLNSPLRDNSGAQVLGGWPRFSPVDSLIAYSTSSTLSVFDLKDSSVTVLARASAGRFFAHPLWVRSGDALLVSEIGPPNRTLLVDAATGRALQWPYFIPSGSSLSPREDRFVYRAPDNFIPFRAHIVLYVRSLSDTEGSTIRPLTAYSEAASGPVFAP